MSPSADDPQIGPIDVDSEALAGEGESLSSLLDHLGVALDAGSREDAPSDGWRVLRQDDSGAVTIGAPAEPSAKTWRIAQIGVDRNGTRRPTASVHPEAMPLRRSRAERGRGLTLQWAPLSQEEAENDRFVIDIVNTGESRWRPDGDQFLVVGFLTLPGSEGVGASFGFFGGQNAAVPLDPGEYARVQVTINESQWSDLEPGRYELHATLAMLPVRSTSPLPLDLTRDQIDQHRSRLNSRTRGPADVIESHRRQLRHQRAVIEGASKLEEIVRLVADAATDEEVARKVGRILHDGDEAATVVINTPLAQFSKSSIQRLQANVLRTEQQLESLQGE